MQETANVIKGWRTEADSVSTAVGQRWRLTTVYENVGNAVWKTHVSTAVGQRWRVTSVKDNVGYAGWKLYQ